MAKDKLTDYSATNGSNTDVGGINIDEGMLPSAVNNSIRELMTHQKEAFGSGTPLYVDQTNNRLGIGSASPARQLTVENTIANAGGEVGILSSDSSTSGTFGTLHFGNNTDTSLASIRAKADGSTTAGKLEFSTEADGGSIETRMTIDSSGNVGIGATDPNHGSHDRALLVSNTGSGARSAVEIEGNSSNANGTLTFLNNGSKSASIDSRGTGTMTFNGASTEYARFNSSGELIVGASTFSSSSNVKQITGGTIDCMRNTTSAVNQITFQNPNGEVGSIFTSSSSTSYQTSSDHRLKEAIVDMTGAIARVKQLAPKRFNFIADPDDTTVDGFLAHEAQTVVPEAVSGTHNEVETWTQQQIDDGDAPDGTSAGDNKLDDDGNTIPKMQGIDQSKLVPLLTGALQEAVAKIEALETRVAALEA